MPLNHPEITYQPLTQEGLKDAALIIGQAFASGEPMASALGISPVEIAGLIEQFGDRVFNLSFVAKFQEQTAAAILAADWCTPYTGAVNPKFEPILHLLGQLGQLYGMEFVPQTALHIEILAVAPQYQGQKIAQRLLSTCLDQAICQGYTTALAECTGSTSQHIFGKFGFQDRAAIAYKSFCYSGQPVFANLSGQAILLTKSLL